jgi:hypothetical protein
MPIRIRQVVHCSEASMTLRNGRWLRPPREIRLSVLILVECLVAVGVVAGDLAELVAAEFGGLAVVRGRLLGGGVAGERSEFEQGAGDRAVEVAVGDDGAGVGAAGSAVGGVQVLDQLGAGLPERDGPWWAWPESARMSPSGMPAAGIAVRTGTRVRAGSWRQEQTVIRRASSGAGGPCSSRIMVLADA